MTQAKKRILLFVGLSCMITGFVGMIFARSWYHPWAIVLLFLGGGLTGKARAPDRVIYADPNAKVLPPQHEPKEPDYWRAMIKSWIGVVLAFASLPVAALLKNINWILALIVAGILAFWGLYWATAYWTYITKK